MPHPTEVSLRIVVLVKQVPKSSEVSFSEHSTILRDKVEAGNNPFDEFALETALRLRAHVPGSHVTVLTMGPEKSIDMLQNYLRVGADDAILLSDRRLAGADTLATGRTLARAIRVGVPLVNLVLCGQFATDGDTGQTGPCVAEFLGFGQITYCSGLEVSEHGFARGRRSLEQSVEEVEISLPLVACMVRTPYELRQPTPRDVILARRKVVERLDFSALALSDDEVGLRGSATKVAKVFRPEIHRQPKMIVNAVPQEQATALVTLLAEAGIIN